MIAEVSVAHIRMEAGGQVLEAVVRREMGKQGSKTHRPPSEPPSLTKVATGIAGLDDILEGGFPAGRTTLISGGSSRAGHDPKRPIERAAGSVLDSTIPRGGGSRNGGEQ